MRKASRLILLDELNQILLFEIEDLAIYNPQNPVMKPFWITPGGGLESNETFEEAAHRELWEETGMQGVELGPWVWTREIELLVKGEPLRLHERFFLTRVQNSEIVIDNIGEEELKAFCSSKWWSLDALSKSPEPFAPSNLGDLLQPIIQGHIPTEPIKLAL